MSKEPLKIVKHEPEHWNSTETSVPTLVTFRDAAERTEQKERNVRLWADGGKIETVPAPKSKPDAKTQKRLVVLESLESFLADRPTQQKETLPVPAVVFEEMQLLTHQLITESQGHAVEKTKAEFLREQVQNRNMTIEELKTENQRLAAELEAAKTLVVNEDPPSDQVEPKKRQWWHIL